jgi:predicted transcriptional regulator of viral defense system
MGTTSHGTNLTDSSLVALLADEVGTSFTLELAKSRLPIDRAALRRLLRSGHIARIGHGRFAIVEVRVAQTDDRIHIATAPFAGEPHYVSWWAALARYGLTEQDPLTIAVAVRARHRDQMLGPLRVRPIFQGPARFYGATTMATPSGPVRIARREKAIVDSIDRPELAGGLGEVVKAVASDGYDAKSLIAVARRHPSRASAARLGYLLEALRRADADELLSRVRRKSEPVRLDVSGERGGPINQRWRIIENVPRDRLDYWASS